MSNSFSNRSALPLGISSDARAFPDLDGLALRIASSSGAWLTDAQGRRYVDYVMAMGATILGHAHPLMVQAVSRAVVNGPMPGLRHDGEDEAAAALVASNGELRNASFVNSGSEAVHLACRIARTATGRPIIAKVAAGYDGWYDGIAFGLSGSPEAEWVGERPIFRGETTLIRYNDEDDVDTLFKQRSDIAAVLVEPVLANAGSIEARDGFLRYLSHATHSHGALVIADEVLTGLRLHPGITAHRLGLEPDLATMGKAIGSGVPVGAVLGTDEAFQPITTGRLRRYGTYNGSPMVTAAVAATMKYLTGANYAGLMETGRQLRLSIVDAFANVGMAVSTSGLDSAFSIWFCPEPPRTYAEAVKRIDAALTTKLHLALRRAGVMTMPYPWGRLFLSFAHGPGEFERTITAIAEIAHELGTDQTPSRSSA